MTKSSKNPGSAKAQLSKSEKNELADIMAKILRIPRGEVVKSIWLFTNLDPTMKNCLHALHKMNEKDYVSALMLLDYLLIQGEFATDILD